MSGVITRRFGKILDEASGGLFDFATHAEVDRLVIRLWL